MGRSSNFEQYLRLTDLTELLSLLGEEDVDRLLAQVQHFTCNEAEHRDEIVLSYFGKEGIDKIVNTVVAEIGSNRIREGPAVLDVGAGIGTFTVPIGSRAREILPNATFYAMDLTPAMLKVLAIRAPDVVPLVGIAENITGSIRNAQKDLEIPNTFDIIISILTLHHCPDMGGVFASFNEVLNRGGKAVVVDLCEHPFVEFREEMGDYHLGFKPEEIERAARVYFDDVRVQKLPSGCRCSDSGRSAELFISTMVKKW